MEGRFDWKGQEIKLIDLPGIYSRDSYTIEERTAKQFLDGGHADVIVNVMDASFAGAEPVSESSAIKAEQTSGVGVEYDG